MLEVQAYGAPKYAVNELGDIWRIAAGYDKGKVRPYLHRGWAKVDLKIRGQWITLRQGQVVLESFGQFKAGRKRRLCHLDGNVLNCAVSNIFWGTEARWLEINNRQVSTLNPTRKLKDYDRKSVKYWAEKGKTVSWIARRLRLTEHIVSIIIAEDCQEQRRKTLQEETIEKGLLPVPIPPLDSQSPLVS